MKISSKGRYALASMVVMSQAKEGETFTVIGLSEKLGISKIYLEQVFSLLRQKGLVKSTKGSKGGYSLAKLSSTITAYDILSSTEVSLFDNDTETKLNLPHIDTIINEKLITPVNSAIREIFGSILLSDIAEAAKAHDEFIYYI
jgi:Rrf2 family protein